MSNRSKNIMLKFIFILLAVIGTLYVVNLLSIYFAYTPSTVLAYMTSGALIALTVSLLYDKLIWRKKSPVEIELEVLKYFVMRQYGISEKEMYEEIEAKTKLDKEIEVSRKDQDQK